MFLALFFSLTKGTPLFLDISDGNLSSKVKLNFPSLEALHKKCMYVFSTAFSLTKGNLTRLLWKYKDLSSVVTESFQIDRNCNLISTQLFSS